jgi:lysophospholipase L1-like esterase
LWLVPSWVPWAARIRLGLREGGAVAQELGEVDTQPDGIHPTAEGYQQLANRIAPLVMP